jgi:DNA polymerase-1
MWTIQLSETVDGPVVVYADQPGYEPIKAALDRLKQAKKVVFHNGMKFDLFAIEKLFKGTLTRDQIVDSLIIARMVNYQGRHSLAEIGEALGFPKIHFTDFSKFSDSMANYGAQDVRILQEAWKGKKGKVIPFGQFYTAYQQACDLEFQVAYVIAKQEQHGFRFDMDKALKLEGELRQEKMDLERELQVLFPTRTFERYSEKVVDKITGKPKRLADGVDVFNPGSRQQIAERLIQKYGWKPRAWTDGGKTAKKKPKIDETILDELPYPEAKAMSRYFALEKMLGQLADGDGAWIKVARQNKHGHWYVYGAVNTLGARTTRMAHFGPNMGQVSKKDPRMREVWLPDPGHVLVGIDAEGLELRMLAHFLALFDGGKYGEFVHSGKKEDGTDVHSINRYAAKLYLRDSAKTMIYAHNYGCGDAKLGYIVQDDAKEAGQSVPSGSASSIGKALRKKLEAGIKGLGKLIGNAKAQHNKFGWMRGLDGRKISSASAHSALNTLLQGNGSIVMKQAQVWFDREVERRGLDVRYCATVHDEFQVSCAPEIAEEVAEIGKQSITEAGIILGVRCPLVGSADIGNNWKETH